jgi:hypothetical protein
VRSPRSGILAADCGRCGAERLAAYVDLLAAHFEAEAAGVPILAEAGVYHVQLVIAVARAGGSFPVPVPTAALPILPRWDADGRQLWFGKRLLKSYRQPAHRQVAVLAAFEKAGWGAHIDDPFSPEPRERPQDAGQRLHDTIHNLNRGLPAGTIEFHGDGTGAGVRWARARPATRILQKFEKLATQTPAGTGVRGG